MISRKPWVENARTLSIALFGTTLVACGGGGGGNGGSGGPPDAGPGNRVPTITTAPVATPNPAVGGDVVQLSVSASDQDGDALTYTWSQTPATPAGTFSTQGPSTSWTAPTVTAGTSFTLQVTVSDGRGGSVVGSATLYAKTAVVPSFAADVESIFNRSSAPSCTVCHSGTGGESPRLEPGFAWAALVGVSAVDRCTTQKLVEPGDPDSSVLIKRLTGLTCGERMPADASDYFDTHPGELATIRSWILAGAHDD